MNMAHNTHSNMHHMHVNVTSAPHHGNGTHMPHMPMGHMKMYFHFSKEVVILFEGWKVDTTGGIVWSMLIMFLFGIVYEGLKIGREALKRHEFAKGREVKASYSNGHTGGKGNTEFEFI